MSDTIESLLREFADDHPPFTWADYQRERVAIEQAIEERHGVPPSRVLAAMRTHEIPHDEADLVDRWIFNEASGRALAGHKP